MIGFKFEKTKSQFFDRVVVSAVDKARVRNLSKFGAFVRRTAKGLIRKVGKKGLPSKEGQPPKSRTGFLKDWILFAYDAANRSVVVGPQKLNMVFFDGVGKPVSGTVPEVLESGGTIGVLEWWLPSLKKWSRADLRSKRKIAQRQTRIRTVRIEVRPYMAPALGKELPNFPQLWANSITSSAA